MYFTGLELFFPEKHEKDEKSQYTKQVIKQMIIGTSYFPSDELVGQAVNELKNGQLMGIAFTEPNISILKELTKQDPAIQINATKIKKYSAPHIRV